MTLGEKLRTLRGLEGRLRGLDREMTQTEVVRAIKTELGKTISQPYLSLIESGTRPHLSQSSRQLLATFFKVHPGYLVNDPPGFHTELTSEVVTHEDALDRWLLEGAERLAHDREFSQALKRLASHPDSRQCLLLLGEMIAMPGFIERLSETLLAKERT
jgi:transcriptional regulator with XRE-family HTH domain